MNSITPLKKCAKCGNEYPATVEFFMRRNQRKSGIGSYCKPCYAELQRARYRENAETYLASARKRNLDSYWENPELAREKSRARYLKNIDRYRLKSRQRYANNPERQRAATDQWEKKNPEKRRIISRRHRLKNLAETRLKERVRSSRRRAAKANNGGSHTQEEVYILYVQQEGKCFHCRCDLNNAFDQDHWIPISRGGSDYIENIRLLCPSCNGSKYNKLPWEWCPDKYKASQT